MRRAAIENLSYVRCTVIIRERSVTNLWNTSGLHKKAPLIPVWRSLVGYREMLKVFQSEEQLRSLRRKYAVGLSINKGWELRVTVNVMWGEVCTCERLDWIWWRWELGYDN